MRKVFLVALGSTCLNPGNAWLSAQEGSAPVAGNPDPLGSVTVESPLGESSASGAGPSGTTGRIDRPAASPDDTPSRRLEGLAAGSDSLRAATGSQTTLQSSARRADRLFERIEDPNDAIRVGSFALLPSIQVSTSFDDNANAAKDDRESEVSLVASGLLRAETLLARHSFGAQIDVSTTPFDETDERVDWVVSADGRLDLTRQSSVNASLSFTRGEETSESQEAGDSPTVTELDGGLSYARRLRRLNWAIGTSVGRLEATETAVVDPDDPPAESRNSTDYSVFADATYFISRRLTASLGTELGFEDFDDTTDSSISRDSRSVDVDASLSAEVTPDFGFSGGLGYTTLSFQDPGRDREQSLTAEVGIDGALALDAKTRFSADVSRSLEPVTVDDESAAVETAIRGSVARRLSAVSAASIDVEVTRSSFTSENRRDHEVTAGLGYSFALRNDISLNAAYRFSQLFSSEEEDEFYRNVVSAGASFRF